MCVICNLLDKSFPGPTQLAKTYSELSAVGLDDNRHHYEIEEKMGKALEAQNLTDSQLQEYVEAFNDEVERLGSWKPKKP